MSGALEGCDMRSTLVKPQKGHGSRVRGGVEADYCRRVERKASTRERVEYARNGQRRDRRTEGEEDGGGARTTGGWDWDWDWDIGRVPVDRVLYNTQWAICVFRYGLYGLLGGMDGYGLV